jgi:hypothetical protein
MRDYHNLESLATPAAQEGWSSTSRFLNDTTVCHMHAGHYLPSGSTPINWTDDAHPKKCTSTPKLDSIRHKMTDEATRCKLAQRRSHWTKGCCIKYGKKISYSSCIQKVQTEWYLEASKAGAWEKTRLLRRQTLV